MRVLYKYRLIFIALLATLLFAIYYNGVVNTNYEPYISAFQKKFQDKERELDKFLDAKKDEIRQNGDFGTWEKSSLKEEPFLHIYRNDSLIFWNSNQLPVLQFANVHFPSEGVVHLQNGWYYSQLIKENEYTVVATFLIYNEYPYQNEALKNEFHPQFSLPFDANVSLEKKFPFLINSLKGEYLFSINPSAEQSVSDTESALLECSLIFIIILWLLVLYSYSAKLAALHQIILAASVLGLRYVSIEFNWLEFMSFTKAFQPSLYASNELFPNFYEYLLNCISIVFVTLLTVRIIEKTEKKKRSGLIGIVVILSGFGFWYFILVLSGGLIENSSIPLIIDRLFSLNIYSFLTIFSIGAFYFAFFKLMHAGLKMCKQSNLPVSTLAIILFIASSVYFIFEISYGSMVLFSALFPLLFFIFIFYQTYTSSSKYAIATGLAYLLLFCAVTAFNLSELNIRKDKDEKELFANQIATEKDVVTEVEYDLLSDKLKQDPYLIRFVSNPRLISISDFEDAMERRFFNKYWERYEMSFNLFDTLGASLIVDESQNFTYDEIEHIISEHGTVSEINPNIIYIEDNTEQYSYVIRQPLNSKDSLYSSILYCTLKSKKIPEEIGFPRLLISSQTNTFESLENYSIAKYHSGKLITKYGPFNYPTSESALKKWKSTSGFLDKEGFNHYILFKSNNDIIILSSKNYSFIEILTSFSYLFCLYGLLLLPYWFGKGTLISTWKRTLTLSSKIQIVLISVVFIALLGFGWGSGIFVRNQYNTYTNDVIREKMNSINIELRSKLGTKQELELTRDGNYMEYLLRKFSKVFVTDINLFSKDGMLLASSRPKIFNIGLISEQMNPSAYLSVSKESRSEYIHQENIGKLYYASAYLPFYNNEGELLGYMNLQHFGQQEDFENQIQRFLVAIINVFMLLLAMSVILAIFISNWVTSPLRLLQESFAGVKFGKFNQQINYNRNDEIGALVKDYNHKLEELEYAAQQIAKSERESAWREMAKQVAHEIKNPLTPMKLSVQHLLRIYDPSNPDSEKKLKKVAESLIEQIDSLTKIANEFSNFAKMPHLNEEQMDLLALIESAVEVFKADQGSEIHIHSGLDKIPVVADKNQLLRVFNNLIKNAMQSIPEDRKGRIEITIEKLERELKISVSDNGIGIPEAEQSKIFVPYFTTKSTGTGLGLAMVKQIIENHGGWVDLKSEEGVGTDIILYLPIK